MRYSILIWKQDKRSKQGETLVARYETLDIEEENIQYLTNFVEAMVKQTKGKCYSQVVPYFKRQNLMTGREFYEPFDTKSFCSPSSESFWSM